MGLSSSSSKTTSNTSQNSNQTETGTTTPITPDWLTQAAQGYVGRIGAFGDMDPNGFVAPASPLQQQAWQNAGSLGEWRQQTATASQMAQQAGSQGANLAGTGGAMGRWAGLAGLTPNPQLNGGGSAQTAANALGGDKMMDQHPSGLPRPVDQSQWGSTAAQEQAPSLPNAFSGASSSRSGPAYTYQAPRLENVAAPTAYDAARISLGNAPTASPSSYQAPQLGYAPLVSGQGYSAPQMGNAQGYAAARVGSPIGATASAYQAPAVANAPTVSATRYDPSQIYSGNIDNATNAAATSANAASLLDNLPAYQNPYQQQVVSAALADYDNNAAQQRAALEARGARTGAFGGSRFGIAEGQMEGDLARGRASLEAGLLDQGFNTAAGLSQSDAGLRQQANLFNAQNDTGISQFNASSANSRAVAQAGYDMQAQLANQSASDAAAQYGAQSQYEAGLQNAQLGAARDQLQAQLQAQAGAQNAAAQTQNSQFNSGQSLQAQIAQAGLDTDASKYGADMGNQFRLQQAGLDAASGQFNATNALQAAMANQSVQSQYGLTQAQLAAQAGQYNAGNAQQAALANQALQGQYGLTQFGANTNAAAQFAAAQNAAGLAGYQGQLGQAQLQAQLAAQAASQNASANNQMSQFNATQGDAALNRQLQAAGMLGGLANDYGAGTRADLGTMAQLGDQQRAIEQAYAMAGPAQLQLMGQLSGMTPYDILVGRQVNGNTTGQITGTGTQTTTQSPSLFSQLLAAGQLASSFIPIPK
jgi:hypothetical protein